MPKVTSKKVAKVASKLLRLSQTPRALKKISGSVLTQRERKPGKEKTSSKIAKIASKTLKKSPSKKAKRVSGSALSQRSK